MSPALAVGLLRFLLDTLGEVFVQKHFDEWKAARRTAALDAETLLGPRPK